MTDRAEIERLLNAIGRTLEGMPEQYDDIAVKKRIREVTGSYRWAGTSALLASHSLHQSDVIELLVGALRDAVTERDAALAKEPKWISVEERLPKNEEVVIITGWRKGISGKLWPVVMTAFHVDGEMYAQDSMYTWSDGNIELKYDVL